MDRFIPGTKEAESLSFLLPEDQNKLLQIDGGPYSHANLINARVNDIIVITLGRCSPQQVSDFLVPLYDSRGVVLSPTEHVIISSPSEKNPERIILQKRASSSH